jgi:hypothetical protein
MQKLDSAEWIRRRMDLVANDLQQDYLAVSVIRLTRTWVQYGVFGFTVFCIVMGALEALFGD